jgi:methyl-accepting chemotaxis protein
MAEASIAIRDTVETVGDRANIVRSAMQEQLGTVLAITASIDETALAANSIALTIATIRSESETFAAEIEEMEAGFRAVSTDLDSLGEATARFVDQVAAG